MKVTQPLPKTQFRLWTVEEYHRMIDAGILQPDEPVELIEGQILRKMSPQRTPHAVTITLVRRLLDRGLGDRVLIRTQLPVQLSNRSEPEPDVALVIPDELRYLEHHPYPHEIFLIIEIADRALQKDCGLKANNYAKNGIADYWVLDVKVRQLHVFRKLTNEGYASKIVVSEEGQISPLYFPELTFKVSDMLPPSLV